MPLDRPLVERLDRDIHPLAGRLGGDDPVGGGVREDGARRHGIPPVAGLLPHLVAEEVGRVDPVLARHDLQRRCGGIAQGQSRDDVRRDEAQDGRSDRGRHDVGGGHLVDDGLRVGGAVDGAEPGDDLVGAPVAYLVHRVLGDGVDRLDERRRDVGEHELVPALVQEQTDEPAADVAGAEVDGFHGAPQPFTDESSASSSSGVAAAFSRATSSSSEKMSAICDRISRCSSPLPAMPTTNDTFWPSQSTPPS